MGFIRNCCIVGALFSINAAAQGSIPDWNGMPWNSTVDKIKLAYGDKVITIDSTDYYADGRYYDYEINDVRWLGENYKAFLSMDSASGGLKKVSLTLDDSTAISNDEKGRLVFAALKDSLVRKYGNPRIADTGNLKDEATWILDSTVASISCHQFANNRLLNIVVLFKENLSSFDVSRVLWGDTKEQVRASEGEKPVEDSDDIISYKATLAGMQCLISYSFVDSMVVTAKYTVQADHADKNDWIADYDTLRSLVSGKNGQPDMALDKQWKNEIYRDEPKNYGNAISQGHLYYLSTWQLPKTNINLMLSGGNHKISLELEYASKKYENKPVTKKEDGSLTITPE